MLWNSCNHALELDKSMTARVGQLRGNFQEILNLQKSERFNRYCFLISSTTLGLWKIMVINFGETSTLKRFMLQLYGNILSSKKISSIPKIWRPRAISNQNFEYKVSLLWNCCVVKFVRLRTIFKLNKSMSAQVRQLRY